MNLVFPTAESPGHEPVGHGLPLVAVRRVDRSGWWFAGLAAVAASLMLVALESRRLAMGQSQAGGAAHLANGTPETIPELILPPLSPDSVAFAEQSRTDPARGPPVPVTRRRPAMAGRASADEGAALSPSHAVPDYQPVPVPQPVPPEPSGTATRPVADTSPANGRANVERLVASRLKNPAMTVVQGTLINAVLETALDSTRPGPARAVVTRDVFGFDGTMLLVPRGSRLYGSYDADVSLGEDRLQIRWTRLLRPDGVTVAINSPATDPLGRAGVAAKVDSHFLQRLGNSLIGMTTNIGSSLLTRNVNATPVVVAVPEQARGRRGGDEATDTQIAPTLRVQQGSRLSVLVQHDLDFSSIDPEEE